MSASRRSSAWRPRAGWPRRSAARARSARAGTRPSGAAARPTRSGRSSASATRGARRAAELAAFHDVASALTAPGPDATVLASLPPTLAPVLDTRHLLVFVSRGAGFEVAYATRAGAAADAGAGGLAARILDRRAAFRTRDYPGRCRAEGVPPTAFAAGLPHALAVPMVAGDETVGVIMAWSADRAFAHADESFLDSVARLVALRLARRRQA